MQSVNKKRIVKNTLMLYTRQILTLLVGFFTVRIVLDVLGVEDYGIYGVIGGVVGLLAFLSASMASATQRFFSFALGQKDHKKLKTVFTVNIIIYVGIAIIALVLLETVGLWFFNERLKIPPDRFESAYFVYQFSTFTFVASILATPFKAIIIAHEDMHIYAYVSVLGVILKLAVVFALMYIPWDKLELFSVLVYILAIINTLIYLVIALIKYNECQFRRFFWDKTTFREIIGFTGWSLFGQITTVARSQSITILLNQVFNPSIVAARVLADTIRSKVNVFSGSFNVGLYPPIIKSYAAGDKSSMFSLIYNGSKITFFLIWVLAMPLIIEMDTVLNLWLKKVPAEAVLFTQLALVETIINSISSPLVTAARAPGRMKTYELALGAIQISIFVVSWVVLKLGFPAYSVFIVAIAANIIMFIVRLNIVSKLIGLPEKMFYHRVIYPVTRIVLLSGLPSLALHMVLPKGFHFLVIVVFMSVIFSSISMYFVGLDKNWRAKVRNIIVSRTNKIFKS